MHRARALIGAAICALSCADDPVGFDGGQGSDRDAASAALDAGRITDAGRADAATGVDAASARVAFSRVEGRESRVYTVLEDGSGLAPLGPGGGSEHSPAWSRRADRLAYTSSRGGTFAVYVLDLETGSTSTVAPSLFRSGSAAWHPFSDVLAFEGVASAGEQADIYVRSSSTTIERLTDDPANDSGPVFGPDARALYFVSNRSGRYEVHRLSLDDRRVVALTHDSGILGRPTIAGCELVYARAKPSGGAELVALDVCEPAGPLVLGQEGSEPSLTRDGSGDIVFATVRFGGSSIVMWRRRAGVLERLTEGRIDSDPAVAR